MAPALSRRAFVQSGAALAMTAPLAGLAGTPAPAGPPRPLAAHRVLFNGDCNFLFYNPELWQPEGGPYRPAAIGRYVATLAAAGVDTLLVNPNTQVAWYPSRSVEYVLAGYRRGDRDFVRPIAAGNAALSPAQVDQYVDHLVALFDRYLDFTDAGVDWLAECARACRTHGVSPWLSYRMNATHFSGAPASPVNCRLFREARHRLSGRVPVPGHAPEAGWVGLNYGSPEVRDHMLALIRDGLEHYDYEGLELDWLRHPVCLEAPASPREVDGMTDWFAALKALAASCPRRVPVGLRVPANLGYLRAIGIDVPALVRRGIVDFLTFSNYWQTPWELPLDELRRELGPDVTLYGGIEDAPNWLEAVAPSLAERPAYQELQLAGDNAYRPRAEAPGPRRIRGTRYLSASAPFLRANAAGKLVLGAEGVEAFNFFVTDQVRVPGQRADYAALRPLADLAALRGTTKHYAFNTASTQPTKIWDVPEQLPVRLGPGQRRALRLPLCAEPAGRGLRLVAQLVVGRADAARTCGVSLNGGWPVFERAATDALLFPAGPYSRHVEEHAAWNYALDLGAVRDGWNELTLVNESPEALDLIAVELGVLASPA
ncbi:MAG: hypothetical protein JSR48_00220 [Verrucomicrobia bacterium]|nr:hypothetical protein [Verrucomicrobiota bacterium]